MHSCLSLRARERRGKLKQYVGLAITFHCFQIFFCWPPIILPTSVSSSNPRSLFLLSTLIFKRGDNRNSWSQSRLHVLLIPCQFTQSLIALLLWKVLEASSVHRWLPQQPCSQCPLDLHELQPQPCSQSSLLERLPGLHSDFKSCTLFLGQVGPDPKGMAGLATD